MWIGNLQQYHTLLIDELMAHTLVVQKKPVRKSVCTKDFCFWHLAISLYVLYASGGLFLRWLSEQAPEPSPKEKNFEKRAKKAEQNAEALLKEEDAAAEQKQQAEAKAAKKRAKKKAQWVATQDCKTCSQDTSFSCQQVRLGQALVFLFEERLHINIWKKFAY